MASSRRLPRRDDEWIDRQSPIRFQFEGREYEGYAGDTVSSALLANGVTLLGRSFKYHRPRSVCSFANHDINVMMASATQTHIRADVTPLSEGLSLSPTNVYGSLKKDRGALLQWLAPMLPVGFYYKVFHTPRRLFPLWERLIRRLAGIGEVNSTWPRRFFSRQTLYCDVLVVGAGASGLAAALAAREAGASVILADENARPGGSLGEQTLAADSEGAELLTRACAAIDEDEGLHWFAHSVVAGAYADRWLALHTPEGLKRVRAGSVVIATGVYEQPAVFHNNDLPGVMLASGARRLLHRHSVAVCRRAVILAANDEAYEAALEFDKAGIEIAAIVDLRAANELPSLAPAMERRGITVYAGHYVHEAHERNRSLNGVTVCPIDEPGKGQTISCDGLLMSVGWAPAAPLLYQAGAAMRFDDSRQQLLPVSLPEGYYATGRVAGMFDLEQRMAHGRDSGLAAARGEAPIAIAGAMRAHSHPYPVFEHAKGKNFVDLDEDLQLKDLINATAEGFDNIELLKRYSTIGMGPSQGKHANMNNIRILARRLGQGIDETGSTTARPFVHPVPMGMLAGHRLRPQRRTPMHPLHELHQAVWMETGHWLRPKYYGKGPEKEMIQAEVAAVHQTVGLIDVSTLGKISVVGPDAVELLQRLYTMGYSKMAVGATRYALMVDEAGIIVDDGIIARLDEEVFYVTTTSSGAPAVYREMQRRVIEWGLNVDLVNITSQMAAMNLAGPESARVLAHLTELDLSQEGFPFLRMKQARIANIDCMLMRVGFVGELGYEIHVPAKHAYRLWQLLMEAGQEYGIRPFGVEAQRLLRLQKGHIIVGQDSDGTSSPFDVAMGWAIRKEKPFFIGKRSLAILERKHPYTLVGFSLEASRAHEVEECNLVIHAGEIVGRVTSIGHSARLGRGIGLAMLKKDFAEDREVFEIRLSDGRMLKAGITPAPFYDPDNLQQKGDIEVDGIEPLKLSHSAALSPLHTEAVVTDTRAELWMADFSAQGLFQVKGAGGHEFLRELGITLPDTWFETLQRDHGGFISRTGQHEYLVYCGRDNKLSESLGGYVGITQGLSVYARSDLHLLLGGEAVSTLLSELCALSLDSLSHPARITYTQLAGISCWIQPRRNDEQTYYQIGCDPSHGLYLYQTLSTLIGERLDHSFGMDSTPTRRTAS
ncbi:MAG: (2Fe-2S)-binding protein [Gammaproteobacteria bacterium]|nr:(2Fe-2S)-binding protein [Gammaproteobacteria bacterium]